ncbi:hypothetical protein BJF95_05395 [Rhizobium oryziradicis]|uniref:Uncharacterized protein n=1 Tax=Rhizobium oryziradicis TaxID=1867956 RepID=A0A1Q8ZSH4_9HYPH|nr:hypothetical protein BJF95_05395 [Rhizobium oryziradicis]
MVDFKGSHYPKEVFFYVRSAVSCRDLEEIMADLGVNLDHATQNRWVVKYSPMIALQAIALSATVPKVCDRAVFGSDDCLQEIILSRWAITLYFGWIGFNPPRANQVEAIGHGRENRIKADTDCGRIAREVDNQRVAPRTGSLPRKDRRWCLVEADAAEQFAESRKLLDYDGAHGLRGFIARCGACSSGRQDEVNPILIAKIDQSVANRLKTIRNDLLGQLVRRRNRLL